jgi:hypothetical protein
MYFGFTVRDYQYDEHRVFCLFLLLDWEMSYVNIGGHMTQAK